MNFTWCAGIEHTAVYREGNGDNHESDGDSNDGDGDRRSFLLTAVFLVLASSGKPFLGFLHSACQLPAEDDVADDETHTGKDGVEKRANPDPDTGIKLLIGRGTKRTRLGRTVVNLHHSEPVEHVRLKQAASYYDGDADDETFVTCADDVDAVGPDDGSGSLGGESHKKPSRRYGRKVHSPHCQLADDQVTGVDIVIQHLPCPRG